MGEYEIRYWILTDDHRVIATDLVTWAEWFEKADRRVAYTEIEDKVIVSTVFLGLDHRFWGKGPPLLFETMVFSTETHTVKLSENSSLESHDDLGDGYRYSSYDDAMAGHQVAVNRWTERVRKANSMSDGAFYAAISRAQDPEGYDRELKKIQDEIVAALDQSKEDK